MYVYTSQIVGFLIMVLLLNSSNPVFVRAFPWDVLPSLIEEDTSRTG